MRISQATILSALLLSGLPLAAQERPARMSQELRQELRQLIRDEVRKAFHEIVLEQHGAQPHVVHRHDGHADRHAKGSNQGRAGAHGVWLQRTPQKTFGWVEKSDDKPSLFGLRRVGKGKADGHTVLEVDSGDEDGANVFWVRRAGGKTESDAPVVMRWHSKSGNVEVDGPQFFVRKREGKTAPQPTWKAHDSGPARVIFEDTDKDGLPDRRVRVERRKKADDTEVKAVRIRRRINL